MSPNSGFMAQLLRYTGEPHDAAKDYESIHDWLITPAPGALVPCEAAGAAPGELLHVESGLIFSTADMVCGRIAPDGPVVWFE